ncbi:VCBS repeat-containing protein, partial [Haliea sp. E1-2-M8]|uniref:FG-GAP repeat domain-containing protein n=1 Tax=Haliea sp. E1-2-M8 TaxID=3064706 RepID=UPI00272682CF
MRKVLAILLLMPGVCRADLSFQFVDGADVGIGAVLEAHKQEAVAAGQSTWLWGANTWSDPSGSYAYFVFHGYGSGFLFKRNADGSYTDISPTPPDDSITRPSENRPWLLDVNNNGYVDILHTGDESGDAASLLNNGDGTWTFSKDHRVAKSNGRIIDANGDEYLDVETYRSRNGRWPLGAVLTGINLSGHGFAWQTQAATLPEGAPREVVARVAAADDRFHRLRIYDLDASTYIATYGGGYTGAKFIYTIRNNQMVDIGLPPSGMAHRPLDVDGDGDLDVVVQYSSAAGV